MFFFPPPSSNSPAIFSSSRAYARSNLQYQYIPHHHHHHRHHPHRTYRVPRLKLQILNLGITATALGTDTKYLVNADINTNNNARQPIGSRPQHLKELAHPPPPRSTNTPRQFSSVA